MNTDSRWQYILLGVGAFVVVIVIVYLRVATYFNIPLVSLLPLNPLTKSLSPPPTLRILKEKPSSVKRLTMKNGAALYIITGKFVTSPTYNAQNILQGDFVIDGDPAGHRIPVVMTSKTDKMTVVRSQGSFDGGKNVVGSEDAESLRQSITAGAPVQLRIYPVAPGELTIDTAVQNVLDGIIAGNWSIPDDFVLHPPMVGLLQ